MIAPRAGGRVGRAARILLLLLALAGVFCAAAIAMLRAATQVPARRDAQDPADLLLRTESLSMTSSDGVRLAAWSVQGRPGAPTILLCHDLGGSKSDLINGAAVLNRAGYRLLLLDFRRHGESGASQSTLGAREKLDVLAAVLHVRQAAVDRDAPIGGWGVGMGAYALALAAIETPSLTALALDRPYREVAGETDRRLRETLPPPITALVPAARLLYDPYFHCRLSDASVGRRVAALAGKNILIIAPTETPDRLEEARALYDAIPEAADGGRSLLTLRRSGLEGLYADDRAQYDGAIVQFFSGALPVSGGSAHASQGPIEVIER